MPRRYGPTAGAGVVVVEQDADKTITPAPLGISAYVGRLYKGDVGDLIPAPTKKDMLKKVGGYAQGSQVPDAAFDFYSHADGAGGLFFVRITDGTEVKSKITVFGRHAGQGYRYGTTASSSYDERSKVPLFTVEARNGGRWGGRKRTMSGDMTPSTDLTNTTLATGHTMTLNEWKDATVKLKGISKTYIVLSNTTGGILTVAVGSTMSDDRAASAAPTDGEYVVILDQDEITWPTQLAGTRRGLALVFRNGGENEDSLFGMDVYEDEVLVASFDNLSMDANSKWYIGNAIDDNDYITITVLYSGTVSTKHRPANWYGYPLSWSGSTLTAQVAHVRSVTSVNDDVGWVGDFLMPSTGGFNNRLSRMKYTLTFTNATTFTVAAVQADGHLLKNMANGTVGTAYAPRDDHSIGFTVFAGAEVWAASDVIVIDVDPFPVDALDGTGLMAGWYLFADNAGAKRSRARIESNTNNTITLSSAPSPLPDDNAAAAGVDTAGITFPLTLATMVVTHSHYGRKTLTMVGSPFANRAALVSAINAAWQVATGGLGDIASNGTAATAVRFSIDDSGADLSVGYDSFIIVDMGIYDVSSFGTLGDSFRVEAPLELIGGYDGEAPDDADYTAEADPSESSLNRLFGRNQGLVKVATPGVTATAVQRAFLAYAEARNYQYRVEVPSNITDDSACADYINDTIGRNDFGVFAFPSYAYVPNPQGAGVVLRTLTGAIQGREAKVAKNWGGYHKAAAGIDVTLPSIVRLPTGNRVINEELLNPVGAQVIKKARGNFVIWGDRTMALDPAWKWKHQREYMSYVENVFREEFDFIIFAINDAETRQGLVSVFQAFFIPEWKKRALRGDKFEDAVSIKIDAENNTNLTMSAGDLNAAISLRLADTVERFVITMGKAGIFEDLSS